MLKKCANTACAAQFRFFSDGRLFLVEESTGPIHSHRKVKLTHYWLCGACSQRFTVISNSDHIAVVVPIDRIQHLPPNRLEAKG